MAQRPIQPGISFGGEPVTGVAAELRSAMSNWPSGVAVLALSVRGRLEAITVNSFISVSLDPPLILTSIGKRAPILGSLRDGVRYTVSALADGQGRVASMIADRVPDLSKLFETQAEPVVGGSLFALVCTTSQMHAAGDHILHLGTVERVIIGRAAPPLLYYRGVYRRADRPLLSSGE